MKPADCRVVATDAIVVRAAQLAADDHDVSQDTVLVHRWSRGLAGVVVGRDPLAAVAAHEAMYQTSIWQGRRGLSIHAISLYDLVGNQAARPVHWLLGRRAPEGGPPARHTPAQASEGPEPVGDHG